MDSIHSDKACLVDIQCDLTEASLEDAMGELTAKHLDKAILLIVHPSNLYTAGRLCQIYNLQCIASPILINPDAWTVTGKFCSISSEGT